MRLPVIFTVLALSLGSAAAQETPLAAFFQGTALDASPVDGDGQSMPAWQATAAKPVLTFKPQDSWTPPASGPLYLEVTYLDKGYGRLAVSYPGTSGTAKPDKFTHMVLMDTGKWVTSYQRLPDIALDKPPEIQVSKERDPDKTLIVAKAGIQAAPFADAHFKYLLDEAWRRPYDGPVTPAPDNTTLKGKIMVGYQAWFRTPNDPSDHGWVHWGDIGRAHFSTDMWPDVSQYPPEALEKAADVKTLSGKTGYLFSDAWPETAAVQFRWMRENNIDGAFVQRFGGDNWAINKSPQWALANIRESADKEGRIWAVEYDLSGVHDAEALDHVSQDWKWLVDEFGLLKDPNYARVGNKPVVFLWGMGVGGRDLTPETTAKLVDFFKNDPKYGGCYFIGGSSGGWRKLAPEWQAVFKTFDGIQGWMSQNYAEDLAQCKEWGIDYYPHVWAGFSWANLKHLPSESTDAYTPRDAGSVYKGRITKALQAGVDRLFVGMWDEYDESTAIIPMSDDPPPTPSVPGASLKFYANPKEQENATASLVKPQIDLTLDGAAPQRNVPPEGFLMRWSGEIVVPADGDYTFAVEGAAGDPVGLWIDGKKVLDIKSLGDGPEKTATVTLSAAKKAVYKIDCLHGSGKGRFQLLWKGPGIDRQPVPAEALVDAWGRFLTNGGSPPDLYLKLTGEARDMLNGKRPPGEF